MIPRRALLAAGPLALAGCGRAEEDYFGKTDPPQTQRLVHLLEFEPTTLDLALSSERMEDVMLSLFEGLTSLDPATGTPMAALSTHYEVTSDGLRYTFYLRGHALPRGIRLAQTSNLQRKSTSGEPSSPTMPACWSDGVPVTAHDFVYSWRRVLDPRVAGADAYLMYCLKNAQEISAGNLAPEKLHVRALEDFVLQVELETPSPFFLELASSIGFCPVPRHVTEFAGARWTQPGRMVSSGAFTLRQHRPYGRIVLGKNRYYYDAADVALSELVFLVVPDGAARVNLYRSGAAAVTFASIPAIVPTLRRRRDFQPQRTYASSFFVINTTSPPFDDVRVRYALNMATDKRPLADMNQAGSIPAVGLVPPTDPYPGHRSLEVRIDGVSYDVLSFNIAAARQLLVQTGKPLPKQMEFIGGNFPDTRSIAQILQRQWREHLGIELTLKIVDPQTWIQAFNTRGYRHIADAGSRAHYIDPDWFLHLFRGPDGNGTGWSDPQYDAMLAEAKNTADPALRMGRLADCERRLLEAMPVLPYSYEVASWLRKPFVRGLGNNLLGRQQFKYVWIDTNWSHS
jgi:ABC-type oligopeptide transport system substrate-binding subunit